MQKDVVILLNMGAPNDLSEVEIFLKNMFNDEYILPIKSPKIRSFVANLITKIRSKKTKKIYEALGGKSPMVAITQRLITKLNFVQQDFVFDYAMRYTTPFVNEILPKYKNAKSITLFALYPHYSQTTVLSSYDDALKAASEQGIEISKKIEPFYKDDEFNTAIASSIKSSLNDTKSAHLVFSAHSLPKKMIENGDLYEQHINEHIELLSKKLDFKGIHLAYQSHLGPVKWLEPNISKVLDGLKGERVVIYPLSFCIDCSESDYELEILYRAYAKKIGISEYIVVKALNDSTDFMRYILNKLKQTNASK